MDRAKWGIFFLLRADGVSHLRLGSRARFGGSSLPIPTSSAISPSFIARLIKGCRVDVRAGWFVFEKT
jgi:hypothetical protein